MKQTPKPKLNPDDIIAELEAVGDNRYGYGCQIRRLKEKPEHKELIEIIERWNEKQERSQPTTIREMLKKRGISLTRGPVQSHFAKGCRCYRREDG